jgi:Family of unknown function (DUF5995)
VTSNLQPQAARLEAVALRLEQRARDLERRHDSRCVFTYAYALLTRRLASALPTSDVADPDWVVSLAEQFVTLYEVAVTAWDEDGGVPPGWRVVFETICRRRTSVIEDLVLGMAAHIMRDLPHALVAVGLEAPDGTSHISDFHALNAILGDAIEEIQDEVSRRYAHYVRWLDRIGGGEDEIATNYGIRLSRGMAWYNATRLLDTRSTAAAAASIERSPQIVVDEVMHPSVWIVRHGLQALRVTVSLFRRWPAADA